MSLYKLNGEKNADAINDWSDDESLAIPEPICAVVNIIGIDQWPTSKFQNSKCFMEFWDCNGNYFKKRIIFNAQGNSSMGFAKKNGAVDLCNDEWIGDDTFSLKIGNWVSQDSFHLKAYYTDYFKGVSVISYKLMDDIMLTRDAFENRPWKKALIDYANVRKSGYSFGGITNNSLSLDTGARNMPDGFPCKVYLNGEFYGMYAWMLKKHRDNFHMTKDNAYHVWLDGQIDDITILGGTINWNNMFEVRNPKNLYLMDGTEYDADFNYGELMDETSEYYNVDTDTAKVKKSKQITATVKSHIIALSNVFTALKNANTAYGNSETESNKQAVKDIFERYFDVDNIIDYLILSDVVGNSDGYAKNWQWVTYDGVRWFICLYDVDMSFGMDFRGDRTNGASTEHYYKARLSNSPTYYVINYYEDELKARYAELRNKGIITKEHIMAKFTDWMYRYGVEAYDAEYKKWNDAPCCNESVLNDGWKLVEGEMGESNTYSSNTTYQIGDRCSYGLNEYMGFYTFEATNVNTNVSPIQTWRYHDSIYRVDKWVEDTIAGLDRVYGFNS